MKLSELRYYLGLQILKQDTMKITTNSLRYGDEYYEDEDIVFHNEVPEAVKGVIHPDKHDSVKVRLQKLEKKFCKVSHLFVHSPGGESAAQQRRGAGERGEGGAGQGHQAQGQGQAARQDGHYQEHAGSV